MHFFYQRRVITVSLLLFYLSEVRFEIKKEQAIDEVKKEKELDVFKRWKNAAPCEGAAGEDKPAVSEANTLLKGEKQKR